MPDARWGGGRGAALARVAGQATEERAAARAAAMTAFDWTSASRTTTRSDGQRSAQRSAEGTVVFERYLSSRSCSRRGRRGVGRGAGRLGLWWLTLPPALRPTSRPRRAATTLAPRPCVVWMRRATCVPPSTCGAALRASDLMRRLKDRFDPAVPAIPARLRGRHLMGPRDWVTTGARRRPPPAAPGPVDACVHCGFCLPVPPTSCGARGWGSPRGLIVLMNDGLEPERDGEMVTHLDGASAAWLRDGVPSGVQYERLIEATRPQIATTPPDRARVATDGVRSVPDSCGACLRASRLWSAFNWAAARSDRG